MAVNFTVFEDFKPVSGITLGITKAGIRYPDRDDLVIIALDDGCSVAGVFTQNAFCAAPVLISREHLAAADIRYMIINTGNANAGTGATGFKDALTSCEILASHVGCSSNQILPFSTGVIGEPLNMNAFESGIPNALSNLAEGEWARAARGIMTTDTLPKGYSKQVEIDNELITITGISKGAGMIMPNMATMLCFVATDAKIAPDLLRSWCKELADASFNRVTVDGDTSTNDSCMLIASNKKGVNIEAGSSSAKVLYDALKEVFIELAQAIVRDGEGATKFVTIQVDEANTTEEALEVAYTVAHSPLVKTALFASDANWGRILAAVGRSGLSNLVVDDVQIYLNDIQIVENGGRSATYTETKGSEVFAESEFTINIRLGRGDISESVWTTDLSHDYVTINADYRS